MSTTAPAPQAGLDWSPVDKPLAAGQAAYLAFCRGCVQLSEQGATQRQIAEHCRMSQSSIRNAIAIGRDPRLSSNATQLPRDQTALYELSTLDDIGFKKLARPETTRADITAYKQAQKPKSESQPEIKPDPEAENLKEWLILRNHAENCLFSVEIVLGCTREDITPENKVFDDERQMRLFIQMVRTRLTAINEILSRLEKTWGEPEPEPEPEPKPKAEPKPKLEPGTYWYVDPVPMPAMHLFPNLRATPYEVSSITVQLNKSNRIRAYYDISGRRRVAPIQYIEGVWWVAPEHGEFGAQLFTTKGAAEREAFRLSLQWREEHKALLDKWEAEGWVRAAMSEEERVAADLFNMSDDELKRLRSKHHPDKNDNANTVIYQMTINELDRRSGRARRATK